MHSHSSDSNPCKNLICSAEIYSERIVSEWSSCESLSRVHVLKVFDGQHVIRKEMKVRWLQIKQLFKEQSQRMQTCEAKVLRRIFFVLSQVLEMILSLSVLFSVNLTAWIKSFAFVLSFFLYLQERKSVLYEDQSFQDWFICKDDQNVFQLFFISFFWFTSHQDVFFFTWSIKKAKTEAMRFVRLSILFYSMQAFHYLRWCHRCYVQQELQQQVFRL